MISDNLLKMLVCPDDHTPLSLAAPSLVERVNRAITAGKVKNKAGHQIEQALDGGLIRTDQTLIYPISGEIPILLIDEGILLDQIE